MSAEVVQQIIEKHLSDWDNAYAEKDAHGYLGHCTPDDTGEQERVFLFYRKLLPFCDTLESKSIIRGFAFDGSQAKVTVQVDQEMVFKKPDASLPAFNKFLLGSLASFVYVSHEIRHLVWVETSEGWLCKSDKVVFDKHRVRRKLPV